MKKRFLRGVLAVLVLGATPARGQEQEAEPAALKAFAEMVRAYRERPAITVKSHVEIDLSQGGSSGKAREVEAEITFAKGKGGRVKLRGFTCWLRDGFLRAVHEATDHSYFEIEDDGSPYYALMNVFVDIPFPHLAIAFGEEEIEKWVPMQFHPLAPYLRPTALVTEAAGADGKTTQRLTMSSDEATLEMLVDPATRLIDSLELRITGGTLVQPGATLTYRYRFEHETYEKTKFDESLLVFDPGDRQRVDMLATLMPPPEPGPAGGGGGAEAGGLVGRQAPPVLLATLEGDAVDLADLAGRVVVLDFFATWCPPCRKALPELHEVERWAREQGLPLKIVVVNVYELKGEENNPDARLAKVRDFWKSNRFSLTVAMDYTDEVGAAYGVSGIPATFIIRSDGVVHAQHVGAPPNYADLLRAEIQEAIQVLEEGM